MYREKTELSSFQRKLAERLNVTFPPDCDGRRAIRILSSAITHASRKVIQENPALREGKIIIYDKEPYLVAEVQEVKGKIALKAQSGKGPRKNLWIIDLVDCVEALADSE